MNWDDRRTKIAILVIVALVICWFIPYSYYKGKITSDRLVSAAEVVAIDDDAISVQLYSMTSSDNLIRTNTFLLLQGDIPNGVYIGQRALIGYSYSGGLYDNPSQSVQVSFYVDGNVLTGVILRIVNPFPGAGISTLKIADLLSDGTHLGYSVAA